MRSDGQSGPDRRASAPPEGRRMVQVLARALEIGRGPPGLARWLARHGASRSNEAVVRLAAELNQLIRAAGVTETLAE